MSEMLGGLAPVIGHIIQKLTLGQKLKNSEQSLILLYSIAQDVKELRNDFHKFDNGLHDLTELINQLRVEIAKLGRDR